MILVFGWNDYEAQGGFNDFLFSAEDLNFAGKAVDSGTWYDRKENYQAVVYDNDFVIEYVRESGEWHEVCWYRSVVQK